MKFRGPTLNFHNVGAGVKHGARHVASFFDDVVKYVNRFLGKKEIRCEFFYVPPKKGLKRTKLPIALLLSHLQAALFNGILIGIIVNILWATYGSVMKKSAIFRGPIFILLIILLGLVLWISRGSGAALAAWINVPLEDHELALYHSPRWFFKDTPFSGLRVKFGMQTYHGRRGDIPLEPQLAQSTLISRLAFIAYAALAQNASKLLPHSFQVPLLLHLFQAALLLFFLVPIVMANTYAANIRAAMSKKINFMEFRNVPIPVTVIAQLLYFAVLSAVFLYGIAVATHVVDSRILGGSWMFIVPFLGLFDLVFLYFEGPGIFHNAPLLRFYWLQKFYVLLNNIKVAYSHLAYGLFGLGVLVFYIFSVRIVHYKLPSVDVISVLGPIYLKTYLVFTLAFLLTLGVWRTLNSMFGGGQIVYFAFRGLYYTVLILFIRDFLIYYHSIAPLGRWDIFIISLWAGLTGVLTAAIAHGVKGFYAPLLFNKPLESEEKSAQKWFDLDMQIFPNYPEPTSSMLGIEFRNWALFLVTVLIMAVLAEIVGGSGFQRFFPYPGIYIVAILLLLRDELVAMPQDRKQKYKTASDFTREMRGLARLTRGNRYEKASILFPLWIEGATGFMWGYDYIYNFMAWRLF